MTLSQSVYVAPATAPEELLAQIWAELLGLERVSVVDNFFDLCGNSFLLLRVHIEVVSRVDPRITVMDLFRYPTIRDLCDRLATQPATHPGADAASSSIELRKAYFRGKVRRD
jgi:hypothetical protein